MAAQKKLALLDPNILKRALGDSFLKLSTRRMMKNPVMFLVEGGAVLTTLLLVPGLSKHVDYLLQVQITVWLWATVLFANIAEAAAEERGKAQADALRRAKTEATARKLIGSERREELISASQLRKGDLTRGALTTFSIANDVAKYFAIIPALFLVTFPELQALNIMRLATPQSAILSAVIFNALIIVALIPLALRGVRYRPLGAGRILRRNLLIYGAGGVIVPFVGIKIIDVLLHTMRLA